MKDYKNMSMAEICEREIYRQKVRKQILDYLKSNEFKLLVKKERDRALKETLLKKALANYPPLKRREEE